MICRALLPLLALSGCVNSTGGENIAFPVLWRTDAPIDDGAGGPTITYVDDATGYTVTLTEATLLTGPLYLWSERPSIVGAVVPLRWWWLGTAHAQDQFEAGFLRAEFTGQVQVDLLRDPEGQLGLASGTAGPSRSAELWLEPDVDGRVDTLVVAGVATRDELVIPFEGAITWDATWVDESVVDPVTLRRVRGLSLEADLTEAGTLELGIDPTAFLATAPFETLLDQTPGEDGVYTIEAGTPVGDVLYTRPRRLGDSGPYQLVWNP